jgi:HEAT repeat protein
MGDERPRGAETETSRLRRALGKGDAQARSAAIDSARPGPGLEDVLLEALGDPEPSVRASAVRALAVLSRARGTKALIRIAGADPSPSVRAEAVTALGAILGGRLGDEDSGSPGGRPA